jgi:hypothetical protein
LTDITSIIYVSLNASRGERLRLLLHVRPPE